MYFDCDENWQVISLSLCWWRSFSIFFLPHAVERAAGQASGSCPRLTCHIGLLEYYLSIFRSIRSFCLITVLPKSSTAACPLDPRVTVWELDPASSPQSMRGEGFSRMDLWFSAAYLRYTGVAFRGEEGTENTFLWTTGRRKHSFLHLSCKEGI